MSLLLYEKIYQSILDEIKQGQLSLGDRVPSEKELADKFNVSRITSKKALDLLAQNNILERIRGKGSFVSNDWSNDLTEGSIHAEDSNTKQNTSEYSQVSDEMKVIGVIVPGISDNHGLRTIEAIVHEAKKSNFHIVIKTTEGKIELEKEALSSMVDFIDGIIIYPVNGEHYNDELLKLVLQEFPIVLIDRNLQGIPVSAVYTKNNQASQELTNYLLDLGHSNLGFISSSPVGTSTIEGRLQGFKDALLQRGLSYFDNNFYTKMMWDKPKVIDDDNPQQVDPRSQDELISYIRKNPQITGFVVSEYYVTLLLVKVLQHMGKKIPEDYSIVCFDSPKDSFEPPQFTHICQHEITIGKSAVQLLKNKFEGKPILENHEIDYTLIEGRSTRPL